MYKRFIASGRSFLFDGEIASIFEIKNEETVNKYINNKVNPRLPNPSSIESQAKANILILEITERCNLSCAYCIYGNCYHHERKNSNNTMSFILAKKRIDDFITTSAQSSSLSLSFYGGEPLMEFDLIKRIVEYCKEVGINRFSLTTNATLFNDEIIDFLISNKISLTISLDGPKQIHDVNRVFRDGSGTHDIISNNLRKIYKRSYVYYKKIIFNCVVYDLTKINEINDYFDAPMYADNTVRLPLLHGTCLDIDLKNDLMYIYNAITNENKRNRFYLFHFASEIRSIAYRDPTFFSHCTPYSQRIYVRLNGDLQTCERVGNCFSRVSDFAMCNLSVKQITKNLHKYLDGRCEECWCKIFCNRCFAEMLDENGFFDKHALNTYCEFTKRKFEFAFHLYLLIMLLSPDIINKFEGSDL